MNGLETIAFGKIESVLREAKKYPERIVKFHVMPR